MDDLSKPTSLLLPRSHDVLVEYLHSNNGDDEFWLDIHVNRQPYNRLGPFPSGAARQRAEDDLVSMMRSFGARDAGLA